jgi:hypothetical protein
VPGSYADALGAAAGVEAVVALDGRGEPHEDDGLDDRVEDVDTADADAEVVQVGADGSAAHDAHLARRYLTVMILMWGAGSLPPVLIGFTGQLWTIIVRGTMQAANVI